MLDLVYSALKKRLVEKTQPAYVDWYMGQYLEPEMEEGGQMLWAPGSQFLEFEPIQWTMLGGAVNLQTADLRFSVHLVDESYHDDDKRITDTALNHLTKASAIFRALMNWRCNLSYVPGFEALADTTEDRVLLESIVRLNSEPDHNLRRQLVSVQGFTTRIYDYSAAPAWEQVLATLALDVQIVEELP